MRSRPEDAAAPRRTRVFVLWLLSLATIGIAGSTLPTGSVARTGGHGHERGHGRPRRVRRHQRRGRGRQARPDLHERAGREGREDRVHVLRSNRYRVDVQSDPPACRGSLGGTSSLDPAVQSEFAAGAGRSARPRPCRPARSRPLPIWNGSSRSSRRCGSRPSSPVQARSSPAAAAKPATTSSCQLVMGLFKPDVPVTVTGLPTNPGATTRWGFGCDPYESNLAGGRCVVNVSDARNFVSVSFDGSDPAPRPPFNEVVHLKVQRAGNGQGQVEGSGKSAGLDDPPWSIELRRRLRFRPSPVPDPGAAAGSGSCRLGLRQLGRATVSQRGHLHLHGRPVPEGRGHLQRSPSPRPSSRPR